jgi:hypothetical protein
MQIVHSYRDLAGVSGSAQQARFSNEASRARPNLKFEWKIIRAIAAIFRSASCWQELKSPKATAP